MYSFILGAYATRCDFSQGPCDWTQSTEDDFDWLRRRGKYMTLMKDIVRVSLTYHIVYNVNWPPERDSKADVSSVSSEGLTLETSALLWPIHIINSVDKTKLFCNTPHRLSTTVALKTCPFHSMVY